MRFAGANDLRAASNNIAVGIWEQNRSLMSSRTLARLFSRRWGSIYFSWEIYKEARRTRSTRNGTRRSGEYARDALPEPILPNNGRDRDLSEYFSPVAAPRTFSPPDFERS